MPKYTRTPKPHKRHYQPKPIPRPYKRKRDSVKNIVKLQYGDLIQGVDVLEERRTDC